MQIRKSLDKLIALAGGCLVFATGGGTIAAGAAMTGSGASLFNAWRESKEKHGPESERVLAQMIEKVRGEFDAGAMLSAEDEQLLDSADHSLDAVLLESIPPPAKLAEAFGRSEGFARAAAMLVLAEVAARDDLFAESGEHAHPLARRFALAAIEAALETALTNRDYFQRLLPYALEEVGRGVSGIRDAQSQQGQTLQRIEESGARVEALLQALEATPTGKRARREIGDNRPFVVLARRINQEVDDPDQALAELTAMVELVLQRQAEAKQGTNLGELVDSALRRIAENSRRGEFELAANEAAAAFVEWERNEAERRDVVRQAGLKLVEANIEQNVLQRDADATAQWAVRGVELEYGPGDDRMDALGDTIDAWYERGDAAASNFDLLVVVAIARLMLAGCSNDRERWFSLLWLGNAYGKLGEREPDNARLKDAAETFRTAFKYVDREESPTGWALTQGNLGGILAQLGEREQSIDQLEAAAAAFRAALQQYSQQETPVDWARIQNNLGAVLIAIGSLTGNPTKFEESIISLSEALKEWTRDRVPLQWAGLCYNLGNAHAQIGMAMGDIARLHEALDFYRAAMEERTIERAPLRWCETALAIARTFGIMAQFIDVSEWLNEANELALRARQIALDAENALLTEHADRMLATLQVAAEIDRTTNQSPGPRGA